MIISFMQSFLAQCPEGRPLVVLPKAILSTWKREFQRWQVEDIPLLDFYSGQGREQASAACCPKTVEGAEKRRILSRVQVSGARKQLKGIGDGNFYELVEETLQQDDDPRRKGMVIKDLREMTSKVLHYYKEISWMSLPGLVDFTVLLNLTAKQKVEVDKLRRFEKTKFKRSSLGSAVYLHPKLKQLSEKNTASGEKGALVSDDKVDEFIGKIDVKDGGWTVGREIFMISGESSAEQRDWSMDKFNNSSEARVLFGSIKACGEGISLVGASRIIILDVHLNPSVSRQAVGRAFRPGQEKKVFTYRLVAAESPEEQDHSTCFKKELIAKRWFEWNEYSGLQNFEMEAVDIKDCGDDFLESPVLAEDVKFLHRR
ncbi:hypothetical protein Ancab_018071 [Ancistrocladus abbreviatus]